MTENGVVYTQKNGKTDGKPGRPSKDCMYAGCKGVCTTDAIEECKKACDETNATCRELCNCKGVPSTGNLPTHSQ